MPSINIIEPAVPMSSLRMDTPIAVASRTGTSILCLSKVLIPFPMYLKDFDITIKALTGNGMKIWLRNAVQILLQVFPDTPH